MLRARFNDALKTAMKEKAVRTLSTVRLILAKLKERDIEVRAKGNHDGIPEPEIQSMLQGMVKQRRESIELYEKGGRPELAQQERDEITVIEGFLPKQLAGAELDAAVRQAIAETGAQTAKDMGRVMAVLKERYAGQLDMAQASAAAKKALG
jgi:uncharacterized protein YqeY